MRRLRLSLPFKQNTVLRKYLGERFPHAIPSSEQVHSTFYDTPDHALKSKGITLQLSPCQDQWLQTLQFPVKKGREVASETRLVNATWLPGPIQNKRIRQFFQQTDLSAALLPCFTLEIRRTSWPIQDAKGNILQIHLETGHISQGTARCRINEIEIELKQGDPQAMYLLALALLPVVPLTLEPLSLAERGHDLGQPIIPLIPAKAAPVWVDKDMTPRLALQAIATQALQHFRQNLPGMLTEEDPEFIHQARVALRRLLSARKIFAPIIADADWQTVMLPMKELASVLGLVRDADVFLMDTLPMLAQANVVEPGALLQLQQAVTQQCLQYRQMARKTTNSNLNNHFQLSLLAWLATLTAQKETAAPALKAFAGKALSHHLKKARTLADQWESLDVTQRHELRKRIKTLRYTVESFAPMYPRQQVRRYVTRLQAMQQILGGMNDRAVAAAVLMRVNVQDAMLAETVARCTQWLAQHDNTSEARFLETLAAFEQTPVFWQA
ncbi:CYTH and CHAD domain-containing protein [Leeia oryzae]|uniref:CYTH and CHAD domain-containing protein n=1 Tax=Leeia oryzae TaxID=356662 RepID=UPI0014616991|nr:CHAD domain-containing protein [Leeia oryzae]